MSRRAREAAGARRPPVTRSSVLRLAIAILFFTAAPTAGDIGSCGQAPDELDPVKFFSAKELKDCEKCHLCGITTQACVLACEPYLDQSDFPRHCYPLVHDGEVCLHALDTASCDEYRQFMNDLTPTIPTECNFCPPCTDGGAPDPDGGPELQRCE